MISSKRIKDLVTGIVNPENKDELLLMKFYTDALYGHTLSELIISSKEEFENFSNEALKMLIYGYCIGQRHFHERIEQFETTDLTPGDGKHFH